MLACRSTKPLARPRASLLRKPVGFNQQTWVPLMPAFERVRETWPAWQVEALAQGKS